MKLVLPITVWFPKIWKTYQSSKSSDEYKTFHEKVESFNNMAQTHSKIKYGYNSTACFLRSNERGDKLHLHSFQKFVRDTSQKLYMKTSLQYH